MLLLPHSGPAVTVSVRDPGMTWGQTASPSPFFPAFFLIPQWGCCQAEKHHLLLLYCHLVKLSISTSQQTASCWFHFYRVAKTLPSNQRGTCRHQKLNYIYSWGDRCFLQMTCWAIFKEREKRKRKGWKCFSLPFSLPLVTHLIKWTGCSDLLYLSPAGWSSYLKTKGKKRKRTWRKKSPCTQVWVCTRTEKRKGRKELLMEATPAFLQLQDPNLTTQKVGSQGKSCGGTKCPPFPGEERKSCTRACGAGACQLLQRWAQAGLKRKGQLSKADTCVSGLQGVQSSQASPAISLLEELMNHANTAKEWSGSKHTCRFPTLQKPRRGTDSLPTIDFKFSRHYGRKSHGLNQYFPKHAS